MEDDRLTLYELIRDKISTFFVKTHYNTSDELFELFCNTLTDKMVWNLFVKGLFHHLHYIPKSQLNQMNDQLSAKIQNYRTQQIKRRELSEQIRKYSKRMQKQKERSSRREKKKSKHSKHSKHSKTSKYHKQNKSRSASSSASSSLTGAVGAIDSMRDGLAADKISLRGVGERSDLLATMSSLLSDASTTNTSGSDADSCDSSDSSGSRSSSSSRDGSSHSSASSSSGSDATSGSDSSDSTDGADDENHGNNNTRRRRERRRRHGRESAESGDSGLSTNSESENDSSNSGTNDDSDSSDDSDLDECKRPERSEARERAARDSLNGFDSKLGADAKKNGAEKAANDLMDAIAGMSGIGAYDDDDASGRAEKKSEEAMGAMGAMGAMDVMGKIAAMQGMPSRDEEDGKHDENKEDHNEKQMQLQHGKEVKSQIKPLVATLGEGGGDANDANHATGSKTSLKTFLKGAMGEVKDAKNVKDLAGEESQKLLQSQANGLNEMKPQVINSSPLAMTVIASNNNNNNNHNNSASTSPTVNGPMSGSNPDESKTTPTRASKASKASKHSKDGSNIKKKHKRRKKRHKSKSSKPGSSASPSDIVHNDDDDEEGGIIGISGISGINANIGKDGKKRGKSGKKEKKHKKRDKRDKHKKRDKSSQRRERRRHRRHRRRRSNNSSQHRVLSLNLRYHSLSDLSEDVWIKIFQYLPMSSVMACERANHYFKNVAGHANCFSNFKYEFSSKKRNSMFEHYQRLNGMNDVFVRFRHSRKMHLIFYSKENYEFRLLTAFGDRFRNIQSLIIEVNRTNTPIDLSQLVKKYSNFFISIREVAICVHGLGAPVTHPHQRMMQLYRTLVCFVLIRCAFLRTLILNYSLITQCYRHISSCLELNHVLCINSKSAVDKSIKQVEKQDASNIVLFNMSQKSLDWAQLSAIRQNSQNPNINAFNAQNGNLNNYDLNEHKRHENDLGGLDDMHGRSHLNPNIAAHALDSDSLPLLNNYNHTHGQSGMLANGTKNNYQSQQGRSSSSGGGDEGLQPGAAASNSAHFAHDLDASARMKDLARGIEEHIQREIKMVFYRRHIRFSFLSYFGNHIRSLHIHNSSGFSNDLDSRDARHVGLTLDFNTFLSLEELCLVNLSSKVSVFLNKHCLFCPNLQKMNIVFSQDHGIWNEKKLFKMLTILLFNFVGKNRGIMGTRDSDSTINSIARQSHGVTASSALSANESNGAHGDGSGRGGNYNYASNVLHGLGSDISKSSNAQPGRGRNHRFEGSYPGGEFEGLSFVPGSNESEMGEFREFWTDHRPKWNEKVLNVISVANDVDKNVTLLANLEKAMLKVARLIQSLPNFVSIFGVNYRQYYPVKEDNAHEDDNDVSMSETSRRSKSGSHSPTTANNGNIGNIGNIGANGTNGTNGNSPQQGVGIGSSPNGANGSEGNLEPGERDQTRQGRWNYSGLLGSYSHNSGVATKQRERELRLVSDILEKYQFWFHIHIDVECDDFAQITKFMKIIKQSNFAQNFSSYHVIARKKMKSEHMQAELSKNNKSGSSSSSSSAPASAGSGAQNSLVSKFGRDARRARYAQATQVRQRLTSRFFANNDTHSGVDSPLSIDDVHNNNNNNNNNSNNNGTLPNSPAATLTNLFGSGSNGNGSNGINGSNGPNGPNGLSGSGSSASSSNAHSSSTTCSDSPAGAFGSGGPGNNMNGLDDDNPSIIHTISKYNSTTGSYIVGANSTHWHKTLKKSKHKSKSGSSSSSSNSSNNAHNGRHGHAPRVTHAGQLVQVAPGTGNNGRGGGGANAAVAQRINANLQSSGLIPRALASNGTNGTNGTNGGNLGVEDVNSNPGSEGDASWLQHKFSKFKSLVKSKSDGLIFSNDSNNQNDGNGADARGASAGPNGNDGAGLGLLSSLRMGFSGLARPNVSGVTSANANGYDADANANLASRTNNNTSSSGNNKNGETNRRDSGHMNGVDGTHGQQALNNSMAVAAANSMGYGNQVLRFVKKTKGSKNVVWACSCKFAECSHEFRNGADKSSNTSKHGLKYRY